MKLLGICLLVGLFVIAPMYLLNYMVMPELLNIQEVYSHASDTAQAIDQSGPVHK